MTGNGIESDFVLPDSLFILDYSTLPSFYPHFGANCRFFCTISMLPDSSAPFCSPNATRGAAFGLRQRVFDPLDSRSRDSVSDTLMLCPRVYPVKTAKEPPLLAGTALLIVRIPSLLQQEHLLQFRLCASRRIHHQLQHIRHIRIPAVDNGRFRLHPRLDFSHPRKSFHAKNLPITRTRCSPSPGIPSPFAAAFLH